MEEIARMLGISEYEAKEADKQDEQELKALEEAEKKLLGRKK